MSLGALQFPVGNRNLVQNGDLIAIEGNGVGVNDSTSRRDKKASGIGLVNVKNRLELLYPNMHELTFGQIDDRYLVTLKLKWK